MQFEFCSLIGWLYQLQDHSVLAITTNPQWLAKQTGQGHLFVYSLFHESYFLIGIIKSIIQLEYFGLQTVQQLSTKDDVMSRNA